MGSLVKLSCLDRIEKCILNFLMAGCLFHCSTVLLVFENSILVKVRFVVVYYMSCQYIMLYSVSVVYKL